MRSTASSESASPLASVSIPEGELEDGTSDDEIANFKRDRLRSQRIDSPQPEASAGVSSNVDPKLRNGSVSNTKADDDDLDDSTSSPQESRPPSPVAKQLAVSRRRRREEDSDDDDEMDARKKKRTFALTSQLKTSMRLSNESSARLDSFAVVSGRLGWVLLSLTSLIRCRHERVTR